MKTTVCKSKLVFVQIYFNVLLVFAFILNYVIVCMAYL